MGAHKFTRFHPQAVSNQQETKNRPDGENIRLSTGFEQSLAAFNPGTHLQNPWTITGEGSTLASFPSTPTDTYQTQPFQTYPTPWSQEDAFWSSWSLYSAAYRRPSLQSLSPRPSSRVRDGEISSRREGSRMPPWFRVVK